MTRDQSILAQPLELPNGFVIPNRLAKAALSEGLGRRDFTPGSRLENLYRRWAGKEPAPDRHAVINVTQYLLNNGLESLRSPRG